MAARATRRAGSLVRFGGAFARTMSCATRVASGAAVDALALSTGGVLEGAGAVSLGVGGVSVSSGARGACTGSGLVGAAGASGETSEDGFGLTAS